MGRFKKTSHRMVGWIAISRVDVEYGFVFVSPYDILALLILSEKHLFNKIKRTCDSVSICSQYHFLGFRKDYLSKIWLHIFFEALIFTLLYLMILTTIEWIDRHMYHTLVKSLCAFMIFRPTVINVKLNWILKVTL